MTERILVVEDEPAIADAVAYALTAAGYDVDTVGDGDAALDSARAQPYDLMVLDLLLPGTQGQEVCRQLRAESDLPILILSARDSETERVVGLELGADDYVTKPFGLSELLMRIEALIRRSGRAAAIEATPRAEELGFGDVRINPAASTVTKDGHQVALTPKELDLLLALVRHPGVVLTRVALLREVWGHRAEVMTRTVDIHVAELRRKLEDVPAKPRHFVTVWKRGYRFDP